MRLEQQLAEAHSTPREMHGAASESEGGAAEAAAAVQQYQEAYALLSRQHVTLQQELRQALEELGDARWVGDSQLVCWWG